MSEHIIEAKLGWKNPEPGNDNTSCGVRLPYQTIDGCPDTTARGLLRWTVVRVILKPKRSEASYDRLF